MKLIIAEKPKVAYSIAKVVGANKRQEGSIEGNGYVVSWCIGHLLGLAEPEAYNEKYKKWNREDLPIIPKKMKYNINPSAKKQFSILKKLMKRSDITEVINACDAGREGELIFRLVYDQVSSTIPMKRLWVNSMEDKAIEEGLNNLRDGKEFNNLYESALARSIADWVVGMNLSRLYTVVYNKHFTIGRVQTPTLNLIAMRDDDIDNFKKELYYTVDINLNGLVLSSKRIDSEEEGKSLIDKIGKTATIHGVEEKEKITRPDKLYDLTTLQREANKHYGYTAQKTLDNLQTLYERKLVTYPRTDSRYLTEDMKETVQSLLEHYGSDFEQDEKNTEKMFNDKKVSDHYAIIPTLTSFGYNQNDLTESEHTIFNMIKRKLLMACSPSLEEKTKKITVIVDDYEFTANGKTVLKKGFKLYDLFHESKDVLLPDIQEGDELDVSEKKMYIKHTTPPSSYTEDTLLSAMEKAGVENLDKDIEVERQGLGTPATRHQIIEKLIQKKYIVREKKTLKVTPLGKKLINVVDQYFKEAKTTAEWEMALSKITEGNYTKEQFLNEINNLINDLIEYYKNLEHLPS